MNHRSKLELLSLVDALCEEIATAEDAQRLETLVLNSAAARRLYVESMTLHGMLYWDAAGLGAVETGTVAGLAARSTGLGATALTSSRNPGDAQLAVPLSGDVLLQLDHELQEFSFARRRTQRRFVPALVLTTLVLLLAITMWWGAPDPVTPVVATTTRTAPQAKSPAPIPPRRDERAVPKIHLGSRNGSENSQTAPVASAKSGASPAAAMASSEPAARTPSANSPQRSELSSDDAVVARINEALAKRWQSANVTPAAAASDGEWVRRAYLDLAGRIPTTREAELFFQDPREEKRQALIDILLSHGEFARHQATIWTNLLVGRSRDRKISRETLKTWLEREFAVNRSWRETVTELVAARGTSEESGPANFLLAHLNNQAVPATAITARIFLCEQLQCTQCHEHPVVKSWGQDRFWELNAFFQQTNVRTRRVTDPQTGVRRAVPELIDAEEFGPTYYETLRGVMHVAYPKFAGYEITPSTQAQEFPLRDQLAGLLFSEERPQPARAFVNRTWAQFMGSGFTNPVDDMGPHTPVSHPELLEDLTAAFVESGYDVRRLVRWICESEAYQLSSRPPNAESVDRPDLGERPLFSRMYVKPLSAEQLFDSLRIAGGLSPRQLSDETLTLQRENWLRQFYSAVDTEENGESSTFDGSLPQALMMMNGDLIEQATNPREGRVLADVLSQHGNSEAERIRQLSLAALSRYPSKEELTQIRDLLRRVVRQQTTEDSVPPQLALAEGLKDVYWAYLNSSEFAVNH